MPGLASVPPPLVFQPFIVNVVVILVVMVLTDDAAEWTMVAFLSTSIVAPTVISFAPPNKAIL